MKQSYSEWFNDLITQKVGPWKWNDTGVDAVLIDSNENETVLVEQVLDFFSSLKVPGLKEGNVRQVQDAYQFKTVTKALSRMITMAEHDWVRVVGSNGSKIHDGIKDKLSNVQIADFLGSTTFFGRGLGKRKFRKLCDALKITKVQQLNSLTVNSIVGVEGFDVKTATKIIDGIKPFERFYEEIIDHVHLAKPVQKNAKGIMADEVCVFTGVRSAEMEKRIVEEGGTIGSGVSSKTTLLIAENIHSTSGKAKKARDLGIKIITLSDLENMLA